MLLSQDALYEFSVLHRESYPNPLILQGRKKNPVAFGACKVQGIPRLEVSGPVQPPFSIPESRWSYDNRFDAIQPHYFLVAGRKVVVRERYFVVGDANKLVGVNRLGHHYLLKLNRGIVLLQAAASACRWGNALYRRSARDVVLETGWAIRL
jgi:hypothetical protein